MRRYLDGNQDAARAIYDRYAERLRIVARSRCSPELAPRLDADDIVQSVFVSFFKAANRGLYDVPAGEELWGLFLCIALNKIRTRGTHHRAVRRDVRTTVTGKEAREIMAGLTTRDEAERQLVQMTIADFLDSLPQQHRDILCLRIDGCEVSEVAQRTGRTKRTVERVLQSIRKSLSDLLEEEA